MEAAARDLERFKGFKRLKAGKRQAFKNRGLCSEEQLLYDQRAWWKLPRGIWSVLRVLSV